MSLIRLGEVTECVMGQAPPSRNCNDKGEGTPFVKAGEFSIARPVIREWTTNPLRMAKRSDVLVCVVGATCGKINLGEDCAIGRSVAAVRPMEGLIDQMYLYYFLQSWSLRLRAIAQGAAQTVLTREMISNLEIPLPPLEEQKRIAAILDKADAIRRKRQQAIELADQFLRSVFLDMFGDPVTNPKGWDEAQLADIALVRSGVTKGRNFKGKKTVTVPYMRVANVQDGHIALDDVQGIEVLESDVDKYRLLDGDLLLTEGGDPDKLGRGAVWRGEVVNCIHQNHIFCVRANSEKVHPEFLSAQIGSQRGKRYFLKVGKQTTGIATINKTVLSAYPALLPPLELQHRYVDHLRSFRELLTKKFESEQNLEDLFLSLSQQAFKGQLSQSKAA